MQLEGKETSGAFASLGSFCLPDIYGRVHPKNKVAQNLRKQLHNTSNIKDQGGKRSKNILLRGLKWTKTPQDRDRRLLRLPGLRLNQ